MPGTIEGGRKSAAANKERHGENFYREIGAIGGRARVPKGFALNKELARKAGRKGGRISKRGTAVETMIKRAMLDKPF